MNIRKIWKLKQEKIYNLQVFLGLILKAFSKCCNFSLIRYHIIVWLTCAWKNFPESFIQNRLFQHLVEFPHLSAFIATCFSLTIILHSVFAVRIPAKIFYVFLWVKLSDFRYFLVGATALQHRYPLESMRVLQSKINIYFLTNIVIFQK